MSKKDLELFNNQIIRQYDMEMKTKYKQNLDFSPFKAELDNYTEKRHQELKKYIIEKTIREIQNYLKKNIFTVEELVLFYLKRINDYSSKYNALIELNPDALYIARKVDKKRQEGNIKSPISGIPIILKDNIGTKDKMHNSAGSVILQKSKVVEDSPIVKRIKEKDAIIIGKANMSEWAYYMSSEGVCGYSALGGQTKNPYGKFDVGGSSSGSAVTTALNLAAATLGSETCGSIVYPSNQNNVVGLKPTLGLWESDRIIPIAPSFDTAGPMTKFVEDAALLTYLLTGNEDFKDDDFYKNLNLDNDNLKIGVVLKDEKKNYLGKANSILRDEDKAILNKAMDDLKNMGFQVEYTKIKSESFEVDMGSILEYEFKESIKEYLKEIEQSKDMPNELVDIWEFNNEDIKNRAPYGHDLIQKSAFTKIKKDEYKKILKRDRQICQNAIDEKLEEYDILLSLSNNFSLVYAYAGYPALCVPAGFRSTGEPVGITFTAGPFQEAKLLNAGYIYEQNTKHRKSPSE
ncbi:MAG: amidase family protein [Eubacteriales bacterium]